MTTSRSSPSSWLRPLLVAAGLACVALGLLGLFLPLLPTTPFLLLAAGCFARSSDRLHGWMLGHPRLGPLVRDWEAHGAIRPHAKRTATLAILGSGALSLSLLRMPWISRAGILLTLAGVLGFIWTRPEGPTRDARQP